MTIFAFQASGTTRLGRATPMRKPAGASGHGVAFRLPETSVFEPAAPPEIHAAAEATRREPDLDAGARRDRAARRHGQDLLGELSRLQQNLLGDAGGMQTALERLATLARAAPVADDPRLGEILDGIVLRAEVEIARRAQPPG